MASYFATTTELLLDASARALLLAALAAMVLRVCSRGNANFRHRAWTAVLWGMLLMPALAQLTPGLSLLPSGWRWESSATSDRAIATKPRNLADVAPSDSPAEPAPATLPEDWADRPTPQPLDVASTADDREQTADGDETTIVSAPETVVDRGEHRRAAMPETAAIGWPGMIVAVYLCGVALLATRLMLGYLAVRRLVRRATDIPRPPGCRARLAASDAVRMPVTVGLVRPVILLPADWSRWSPALLASVVAHEQAHVERRDHLVLLAAELNRCLYWFHPVAWFLRRRLSALAEQCCDDAVIAALRSRGDYARHLLEIAGRLTTNPQRLTPLAISMARSSRVESRIVAILDERRPLAGRLGRGGALALAAVVGPIVLLAAGLRAADPSAEKAQEVAAKTQSQPEPEKPAAEKLLAKGLSLRGSVVLASDGLPAAGAEVRLLLNKVDWNRSDFRKTTTDAQGTFAFVDVPAGSYCLVAALDSLASLRKAGQMTVVEITEDHPSEPVQMKLWPAPTIAVHVTSKADGAALAGAQVRVADPYKWDEMTDAQGNALLRGLTPERWQVTVQAAGFAQQTVPLKLVGTQRAELNFALQPGGKIHGTVKDQDGKPLPDLHVNLDLGGGPPRYWLSGTQTDAEGRYRFDFVPLGDRLVLHAGGKLPYTPESREAVVPLDGDRDVEVDLALERRPVGGSVQGMVTDEAGKPVVGATVTQGWSLYALEHGFGTVSDAAGRFKIDDFHTALRGIPVVVRAKGFAPQATAVTPGPPDHPTEIAIKLEPGHRIRGRVLDVSGGPIARVKIECEDQGGRPVHGIAETDAQGRFEIDSLPADCRFDFSAEGYSPISEAKLALDGEQEVTVTLQPQGVIRGRVVNAASGAPVTAFRVRIEGSTDRGPDDPQGGTKIWRIQEGEQFDAADGRFVLDDLMVKLPIQVTVEAQQLGLATLRRVLPRPEADAETVEFKLGPTDPAAFAPLSGVVVDEQGKPKADAQLRLIVAESRPDPAESRFKWSEVQDGRPARQDGVVQFLSATTDRKGAFHFDHVRTDQEAQLWYWGEGVSAGRLRHLEQLAGERRQQVRIENPAPGAIEGKINRQKFPELWDITAEHRGDSDSYSDHFYGQPNKGEFRLGNLPPGHYVVEVRVSIPGTNGVFANYVDENNLGAVDPAVQRQSFGRRQAKTIVVEPGKTTRLDIGF